VTTKPDELQARMDDVERRMAHTEETTEARLTEIIEVMGIVLDALTYMSGAVERLKVDMFEERGWRQ
jgi:hypothetical protein